MFGFTSRQEAEQFVVEAGIGLPRPVMPDVRTIDDPALIELTLLYLEAQDEPRFRARAVEMLDELVRRGRIESYSFVAA